jgi:methyl-accepting chemotaxis protein
MTISKISVHRRRKRVVLEKDFQYRFTLRLCLISGLLFAFFTGISLFFIKMSYEMLIQSALIQMPEVVTKLRWEFKALAIKMLVSWIFFICAIFLLGVLYTQRIAGPIYALRRKLQDMTRGSYPQKLIFRKNDEFRSLEQSYNQAIDQIDTNFRLVHQQVNSAKEHLLKQAPQKALEELDLLIEKTPQP